VKFLRWGHWRINLTGRGVLAMITNHGYLDNPTFRGMRRALMQTFNEIYVLNLHGNAKKKEVCPDGSPDKNVFDIQQGVAIGIFVKQPGDAAEAWIYHADLWGLREGKYQALAEMELGSTPWQELEPTSPFYLFVPQAVDLRAEEVFFYAYGVFHAPNYRQRYAEFLKVDFPLLPLTSNQALFAGPGGPRGGVGRPAPPGVPRPGAGHHLLLRARL
jgi:predicted helicase